MDCSRMNLPLHPKRLCLLLTLPIPVLLFRTVTVISLKNVNEEHGVYVLCGQLAQDNCH
jgi:hypothetical protein